MPDPIEEILNRLQETLRRSQDTLTVMEGIQTRQARVVREHGEWLQEHDRAIAGHREWLEEHDRAAEKARREADERGRALDERIDKLVSAIGA